MPGGDRPGPEPGATIDATDAEWEEGEGGDITQPEVEALLEPDSGFVDGGGALEPPGPVPRRPVTDSGAAPAHPEEGVGDDRTAWSALSGWYEEDEAPPLGDGPFPVDAEAPHRGGSRLAEMQAALRSSEPSRPPYRASQWSGDARSQPPPPPPAWGLGARGLDAPERAGPEVRVARRRPSNRSESGTEGIRSRSEEPPRRYPDFAAYMAAQGIEVERELAEPVRAAPPVPGTFIPRPPPPPPRPEPTDLDHLLGLMAEGLLVGEGDDGATEIRVTLRDEFFCGTELRVELEERGISARLLPPSREVYRQLAGERHALLERLEQRGLRVCDVRVLEPEA